MFRSKKEKELELKFLAEVKDLNNQIIDLQKKLIKKEKAMKNQKAVIDRLLPAHSGLLFSNCNLNEKYKELEAENDKLKSLSCDFVGVTKGLMKRILELEKMLDEALDAAIDVKAGDAFKMNVETNEDGFKLQQVLFSNGYSWKCGSTKPVFRKGMFVFDGLNLYYVLTRDAAIYEKCTHKELTMREFDEIYKLKK